MEKINNVEDLMGLIELAENASNKVELLKIGRYILIFVLLLFAIATILYLFDIVSGIQNSKEFIFLIVMVSAAIFLAGFIALLKIKKLMNVEYRVLNKLFDLIDPLQSLIKNEVSIMKMATIEMRLSRIDFGNYQSKEKPNRAEKQLNLEKLKERLSLDS